MFDAEVDATANAPPDRHSGARHLRHGPFLHIGVSAAAEGGQANRAGCTMLRVALDLPASAVALRFGQTSRDRTRRLVQDAALLAQQLARQ